MTLRVWWAGKFASHAHDDMPIPVIRLDDLRAVVEGLKRIKELNEYDGCIEITDVVDKLLAQLKGVGDVE